MLGNLYNHSHYSILCGMLKIDALVKISKERGYKAVALTDNANMYGTVEFYKNCIENDIKPIIGVTVYIAEKNIDIKPSNNYIHPKLILLAKNENGYKNLMKLVTQSTLKTKSYLPVVDKELLKEYSNNLVAIIPPVNNEILGNKNSKKIIENYKKTFNNIYIGIDYRNNKKEMYEIAKENNIPTVIANTVYYKDIEDKQAREVLIKIQNSLIKSIENDFVDLNFSIPTIEEVKNNIKEETINNTEELIDSCNVEIDLGNWVFPKVDTDDPVGDLNKKIEEGIIKRKLERTDEVNARLKKELEVINNTGYTTYFLTVIEMIEFMHKNDILTTTRGSVAGSLVSYLTGITNVDPIKFSLPFERFLNKERPSPPDIDLDVADNKRDEVIRWLVERFGSKSVAQIGTFGTLMARASVRDVARAIGHSYTLGDRIAKLIPLGKQGFPMFIDKAMEEDPRLKDLYENDRKIKEVIDIAKKIEGCVRHISTHAAGLVISPKRVDDYSPVQMDKEGKIITQYDMKAVEDAGLLKFDLLGLTNLSILSEAINRVKKNTGIDIDIENIPLDDKKTFKLLSDGLTVGVFQMGGHQLTHFLKELKPTNIHDINAMIALYRPGPMKNIPSYIKRKHGEEETTYKHPKMKNFLENSYGILVYQEDIMFTALELAGYTWKTVDKLRKAIGKKIPEEMKRQEKIFIKGCMENSNMNESDATEIWNFFVPFQGYGFNKAHAASYGKVSYQTAYLKANYPSEYMAALFTADANDIDRTNINYRECIKLGIKLLPPTVNKSFSVFEVEGKDIRYGFYGIKNFGTNISDEIVKEREQNGEFKSLKDFINRIGPRGILNKRSLEALIKVGALGEFESRSKLIANTDRILKFLKEIKIIVNDNQSSLFGSTDITLNLEEPKAEITKQQKLYWERELLGIYISGHPLDDIKIEGKNNIEKVLSGKEYDEKEVLCIINQVKELSTERGRIAFLNIEDSTGSINAACFSDVFNNYSDLLIPFRPIIIKGKKRMRTNEPTFIIDEIKDI